MNLEFSSEQTMLKESISRYLTDRSGRASSTGDAWQDFADTLGILGAALPEAVGGLGGGPVETMIIMEELGSALSTTPYLETIVLAGSLLRQVDSEHARGLLERVIMGECRLAFAHLEGAGRYAPEQIWVTATRDADGWLLTGTKIVVVGAETSDYMIVAARTVGCPGDRDGLSLFVAPSGACGILRRDYRLIDGRKASDVSFHDVRLETTAMLGKEGHAFDIMDRALDESLAALCAEGVGVMRRMLSDTMDYVRQRQQFGQALAKFQSLQHRLVDMYMATERASAATYLATLSLDAAPYDRAKAASAAKVTIGETIRFVAQNAVQLHGAMGMTEELAVGHYFRRATVIEQQFGSVDHHLARYARLSALAT